MASLLLYRTANTTIILLHSTTKQEESQINAHRANAHKPIAHSSKSIGPSKECSKFSVYAEMFTHCLSTKYLGYHNGVYEIRKKHHVGITVEGNVYSKIIHSLHQITS